MLQHEIPFPIEDQSSFLFFSSFCNVTSICVTHFALRSRCGGERKRGEGRERKKGKERRERERERDRESLGLTPLDIRECVAKKIPNFFRNVPLGVFSLSSSLLFPLVLRLSDMHLNGRFPPPRMGPFLSLTVAPDVCPSTCSEHGRWSYSCTCTKNTMGWKS